MVKDSAWVYLRKSRDKVEAADPDILHKHRRELLRLASANGDNAPQVFEELGSGERIHRRPEFARLLDLIERLPRSHGGRLYTTEVSRATRGSLKDQARVEEALSRANVLHVTRGGAFDLRVANDRLMWRLQASLASHELGVYKERVEAARIEMTLGGRLRTGTPPYGWRWDRNKRRVEADPDTFPTVQALCRDALFYSTRTLARMYGLKRQHVLVLLRNPFIAGWPAKRWFPHNGDRNWISPSHLAEEAQWIWPEKPGDYPAACSLEHWRAIQQALKERTDERAPRDDPKGWCRDVVRFVGHEDRRPRLGVWHCPGRRVETYELTFPDRPRLYVAREMIHTAAEKEIREVIGRRDALIEMARLAGEEPQPPLLTANIEGEILSLERKVDRLIDMELEAAEAGDLEEVAAIKRRRDALKQELKEKQGERRAAARSPLPSAALLEYVAAVTSQPGEVWEDLGPMERRACAQAFLDCILVLVEPHPGRRPSRREIVEIRRQPWLVANMSGRR